MVEGRGLLVLEVILVLVVAWGWAIPLRIVTEWGPQVAPPPEAVTDTIWIVSTILFNTAVAVLVLYLMWRTTGSHAAAGLAEVRWWREGVWAAALVATAVLLVPASQIVAQALRLPSWPSDASPEEPRTALTALYFLAAALLEEVVFRAHLIKRLEQLWGRRGWAVTTSAILFTLYHLPSPARVPELFAAGVMFGVAFVAGRRLPRLVLAHWVWNLVMVA